MKFQEKKFKVDNFGAIRQKLAKLGAHEVKHAVETHHYAEVSGNDVVKLVDYKSRSEIHKLSESNGTFTLTDSLPMNDVEAGMKWLRDKGHSKTTTIKMDYTEYEYGDGIVGLYLINDSLYTVIFDFPPEKHKEIQKELDLQKAEVITLPYNKYLEN